MSEVKRRRMKAIYIWRSKCIAAIKVLIRRRERERESGVEESWQIDIPATSLTKKGHWGCLVSE